MGRGSRARRQQKKATDYPVAGDAAASRPKRGRSAIAPPPSQNAGETAADGNHGDTTPTRATRATQRVGAVGVRHNAEGQDTGGFDRKLQRPNRDDPPPRTEVDDGAWDGIGDSSEDEIDDLAKVALEPEPDEMEATATAVEERLSFGGADAGASVLAGDAMDLGAPEQAAQPLLPVVPVPIAPSALDPFTAAPFVPGQPVAQRAAAARENPMLQALEEELEGGDFRIDGAWAPRATTLSLAASTTSARRLFGVQLHVLEAFAPEKPPPRWATEPEFVDDGAPRAMRSTEALGFHGRTLLSFVAFARRPPREVEWVAAGGDLGDDASELSTLLDGDSRSKLRCLCKVTGREIEQFREALVGSGIFHAGNMAPRPPLSDALLSEEESARHAAHVSAQRARAAAARQAAERQQAALRGETLSYDLRCSAELTGMWYGKKPHRYRKCIKKNIGLKQRCKKRHAPRGFGPEPEYWWNEETAAWETYTEAKWNAFCQRCPRRVVPPAGDCICKTCGS